MSVPILEPSTFCCGCSLRTGSLIIAVIDILLSLAQIIHNSIRLKTEETAKTLELANIIIFLVFAIVSLPIGIALLVGIIKRSTKLLKVGWIYLAVVSVIYLVSGLALFIEHLVDGDDWLKSVLALLSGLIFFGLYFYSTVIARSYRSLLVRANDDAEETHLDVQERF